jgi:hypothetical protein
MQPYLYKFHNKYVINFKVGSKNESEYDFSHVLY